MTHIYTDGSSKHERGRKGKKRGIVEIDEGVGNRCAAACTYPKQ
jgi:hypothetical protein